LIVLDTHALIWFRTRYDRLGADARRHIERATWIGVPDIVLWELAMFIQVGEIRVDRSSGEWIQQMIDDPRIELLPITPSIAARTIPIAQAVRQDPSDHIIAATAIDLDLPLITRDAALQRLGGLQTAW
jgi:PIN domain nuclease of toxin-antitoxin system